MYWRLTLVLPAIGLWAGCAPNLEGVNYGAVVQNKFYSDNCAQVSAKIETARARIAELEELSLRARRETGGALVAATVYGPDLSIARSDLILLRRALAEKKCDEPPLSGR